MVQGSQGEGAVVAGRYRLEREIARGGMGVVYEALDQRLDRKVALKQLLQPTPQSLGRMQREALALARVQHPHVVQVFDAIAEGDVLHLVMHFVEGRSLESILAEEGVLDPADAARIVCQLAQALAACHSAGVLHRDVKPANVLLTPQGGPVLVDFGVAGGMEVEELPRGTPSSLGSLSLTQTGALLGTPHYMPPERMRRQPPDVRGDLYSLGATLYHLLTGTPPYPCETFMQWAKAVKEGPPPSPAELDPEVPVGLSAVCMQLLAHDPGERPEAAGDVAQALGAHLAPRTSRGPRRIDRRWALAPLPAALLLAVVGVASLVRGDGDEGEPRPVARADPDPPTEEAPREPEAEPDALPVPADPDPLAPLSDPAPPPALGGDPSPAEAPEPGASFAPEPEAPTPAAPEPSSADAPAPTEAEAPAAPAAEPPTKAPVEKAPVEKVVTPPASTAIPRPQAPGLSPDLLRRIEAAVHDGAERLLASVERLKEPDAQAWAAYALALSGRGRDPEVDALCAELEAWLSSALTAYPAPALPDVALACLALDARYRLRVPRAPLPGSERVADHVPLRLPREVEALLLEAHGRLRGAFDPALDGWGPRLERGAKARDPVATAYAGLALRVLFARAGEVTVPELAFSQPLLRVTAAVEPIEPVLLRWSRRQRPWRDAGAVRLRQGMPLGDEATCLARLAEVQALASLHGDTAKRPDPELGLRLGAATAAFAGGPLRDGGAWLAGRDAVLIGAALELQGAQELAGHRWFAELAEALLAGPLAERDPRALAGALVAIQRGPALLARSAAPAGPPRLEDGRGSSAFDVARALRRSERKRVIELLDALEAREPEEQARAGPAMAALLDHSSSKVRGLARKRLRELAGHRLSTAECRAWVADYEAFQVAGLGGVHRQLQARLRDEPPGLLLAAALECAVRVHAGGLLPELLEVRARAPEHAVATERALALLGGGPLPERGLDLRARVAAWRELLAEQVTPVEERFILAHRFAHAGPGSEDDRAALLALGEDALIPLTAAYDTAPHAGWIASLLRELTGLTPKVDTPRAWARELRGR